MTNKQAIKIIREKRQGDIIKIVLSEVKKWDNKINYTKFDYAIENLYKYLNK